MKKQKRASIGKTFSLVALLTLCAKVIGFVRDMVVAAFYGTGALADAYNTAYLFTGNILILFGGLGGPFHSATVTVLAKESDKSKAGFLMGQVLFATGATLSLVAIGLFLFAPYIVHSIAGNYGGVGATIQNRQLYFEQAILQLRLMSPLIVIAGLIGVVYGILNVFDKVAWPSLSPAIASLAVIAAVCIWHSHDSSISLAAGTLIGAFAQLFVQFSGMRSCNLRWAWSMVPAAGLRQYAAMLGPACLGTLIGQLTIYIDIFFCSGLSEGSWTAVVNANRLVQLPLGILLTAMLVPMLPRFTELAHAADHQAVKKEYIRALRFMLFLSVPLTAILLAIPQPCIRLLFQRGAFNELSTALVTSALFYLAPSIVFYVGRDLITRVFYAYQDSRTPFIIAAIAIGVKALLDFVFVNVLHFGVGGISIATTLITVLNLTLLTISLRSLIGPLGLKQTIAPISWMTLAGAVCGLSVYCTYSAFYTLLHITPRTGWVVIAPLIAASTAIGLLFYFAICLLLQLDEVKMLQLRLRQKIQH